MESNTDKEKRQIPSKIAQPSLTLLPLFSENKEKKKAYLPYVQSPEVYCCFIGKVHFAQLQSSAMRLWGFWDNVGIFKHLFEGKKCTRQ